MRRLALLCATVGLLVVSGSAPAEAASGGMWRATLVGATVHGTATLTELAAGASASLALQLAGAKPATNVTVSIYGGANGTGGVIAGHLTARIGATGTLNHSYVLTASQLALLKVDVARKVRLSVTVSGTSATGKSVRLTGNLVAPPSVDAQVFGTTYKPVRGTPGGTLVIGEWQPVEQLNPYYASSFSDLEASLPILRGCATMSADGKYIPDLCATLPSESNGGIVVSGSTFTMTLHLKPHLLWSDGQPLTMRDLRYTWQWANDPDQIGCASCAIGFPDIDSIAVSSDGLTATVHFADRYAGWLGWLTSPVLPAHYLSTIPVSQAAGQSYPTSTTVVDAPVSGPFTISSVSAAEIDYANNPDYHGGISPSHIGPAYLQGLKLEFFGDKNAEIAAFLNGSIDLALDLQTADYPALALTPASVGAVQQTPTWEYQHFDLNTDPSHARGNGLWDLNVRKALAMAVNKSAIVAADFPDATVALACSPTPPGVWYAKPETCPSYNPAAARALLAQAGWKPDATGIVANAAGHEMNLELCTTSGNPLRLGELQVFQQDLKAIGVQSTIQTADAYTDVFAAWSYATAATPCSIYRGNYDVADFGYILTGSPYSDYYWTYSSSQWPELGDHDGSNDTRFASTAMDRALNGLATDVALAAQRADAGAVQDAYVTGVPEIPLYYRSEVTGVGVHVGNWPGYGPSTQGPTWNVEDWFFKP